MNFKQAFVAFLSLWSDIPGVDTNKKGVVEHGSRGLEGMRLPEKGGSYAVQIQGGRGPEESSSRIAHGANVGDGSVISSRMGTSIEETMGTLNGIIKAFDALNVAKAAAGTNHRDLEQVEEARTVLLERTARVLDNVVSICRDADLLQDVSGSQEQLFGQVKTALKQITTEMFAASNGGTPELGIFSFSVTGTTHIARSSNMDQIINAISTITYRAGGTRLSTGLQKMLAEMINAGGVPAGEVRVEAILSDFKVDASDRPTVISTLTALRNAAKPGEIVFMPLGIDAGFGIDRAFMQQIATNQADIREYPNVQSFVEALSEVSKLICGKPPVLVTASPSQAPTVNATIIATPPNVPPSAPPAAPPAAAAALAAFGLAWCCCRRKKKAKDEETAKPGSELVSVVDPEQPLPASDNPIFHKEVFSAIKPNLFREEQTDVHKGEGEKINQADKYLGSMGFWTGAGSYVAPKGKARDWGDEEGKFEPGAEEKVDDSPEEMPPIKDPTPEPPKEAENKNYGEGIKLGPFSMITARLAAREDKGLMLTGLQYGLEWAEVPVPQVIARPIDKHVVGPVNRNIVDPLAKKAAQVKEAARTKISQMKSSPNSHDDDDGRDTPRGKPRG